MAIEIKTYVSIDSKPRLSPSSSSTSKKSGVFYPDSLEIKYIDLIEYKNKDGILVDGEMHYEIDVIGSATNSGETSSDVIELSSFLRAYDFKKYPLQLECKIFDAGSTYSNEVKQFVSNQKAKHTTCLLSAKELLAKLKK